MNTCFIQGVTHRCGTNYLGALMSLHPAIRPIARLPEDWLLTHVAQLDTYVAETWDTYPSHWPEKHNLHPPQVLKATLGQGLLAYLHLHDEAGGTEPWRVTKTPSTRCLGSFFSYFPACPLVVLVRDPHAVVESAMKTFDWTFEEIAQRWANNARSILNLKRGDTTGRWRLVRYEALVQDPAGELASCLELLDLDPAEVSAESIRDLGVIGSSELRRDGGEMHWKPVPAGSGFDPLNRAAHWSDEQRQQLQALAGPEMAELGYGDASP